MTQFARRLGACLALAVSFALSLPALAAPRLEVVGGNLVDHQTGLMWQPIAATAGVPLPLTPVIEGWRVATADDLIDLFGFFVATQGERVALNSDSFAAMAYFTGAANAGCSAFGPQFTHCFGGWWNEGSAPATYNLATFAHGLSLSQPGFVDVFGITTIGSYTQDDCPFCNPGTGYFTVRAVPEPATAALWLAGLAVLTARRRL